MSYDRILKALGQLAQMRIQLVGGSQNPSVWKNFFPKHLLHASKIKVKSLDVVAKCRPFSIQIDLLNMSKKYRSPAGNNIHDLKNLIFMNCSP